MIWRESLKIGVAEVDRQHEELFRRFNEFIRVVRSEENPKVKAEKISETLEFMGTYVVDHFASEEELQKACGYPNYEAHRQIHEHFKAEIARFKSQFEQDRYNEDLPMEFSGKLLTWLIHHVSDEDQKIAAYIHQTQG